MLLNDSLQAVAADSIVRVQCRTGKNEQSARCEDLSRVVEAELKMMDSESDRAGWRSDWLCCF